MAAGRSCSVTCKAPCVGDAAELFCPLGVVGVVGFLVEQWVGHGGVISFVNDRLSSFLLFLSIFYLWLWLSFLWLFEEFSKICISL